MTNKNDMAMPGIEQSWAQQQNGSDVEVRTYKAGLTKREYFAAMALSGTDIYRVMLSGADVNQIAEYVLSVSDAMIAELNKTP